MKNDEVDNKQRQARNKQENWKEGEKDRSQRRQETQKQEKRRREKMRKQRRGNMNRQRHHYWSSTSSNFDPGLSP